MRGALLVVAVGLIACAPGRQLLQPDRLDEEGWAPYPGSAAPPEPGLIIAARAGALAGLPSLRQVSTRLPDDCTGLARAAYEAAGAELMDEGARGDNGVTAMYRKAERLGALHLGPPRPGDLVFFRETYDRNRNGRVDDGLTHVGVVESLEPGGTVVFVHRSGAGVVRARLTLARPAEHSAPGGRVLNDYLRAKTKRSRAWLTGELFVSYAAASRLLGSGVSLSTR